MSPESNGWNFEPEVEQGEVEPQDDGLDLWREAQSRGIVRGSGAWRKLWAEFNDLENVPGSRASSSAWNEKNAGAIALKAQGVPFIEEMKWNLPHRGVVKATAETGEALASLPARKTSWNEDSQFDPLKHKKIE